MDGPLKLRPKGLFAIITDAAFQDKMIEPYEQKILKKISTFLKLDKKLATAIAVRSKKRAEAGKLGPEVPLNPKVVYQHALEVACADGTIDKTEQILLEALRKLFRITPEFHNGLLKRITAAMKAKKEAPGNTKVQQSAGLAADTALKVVEGLNGEGPAAKDAAVDESDYLPPVKDSHSGEALLPSEVKESIAEKAAAILADIDGWDELPGGRNESIPPKKMLWDKKKPYASKKDKDEGLFATIGKWFKG